MSQNSQQIARILQSLLHLTRGKVRTRWVVLLLGVVGCYLAAGPTLEARLGVDLPGVYSTDDVATATDDAPPPPRHSKGVQPLSPVVQGADAEKLDDILEEAGQGAFKTSAGLVYDHGSVHGHRLKHLMSHAVDDPDRPGQHGVFDETDPASLVAFVDEVYLQALSGKDTRTKQEDGRTIYTVNLRRRVGYTGGEAGGRQHHPEAKHVRLVVDGEQFITAFPVRP